jgi:hypothetical protein
MIDMNISREEQYDNTPYNTKKRVLRPTQKPSIKCVDVVNIRWEQKMEVDLLPPKLSAFIAFIVERRMTLKL